VCIEKHYQKNMIFSCPINFEAPCSDDYSNKHSILRPPPQKKHITWFFLFPNPNHS
jgi:hypothetical protein